MSPQLCKFPPLSTAGNLRSLRGTAKCGRSSALRVRAEGRVVREFREDDNQIINAANTDKPKAVYVSNVQTPTPKKFSKEYRSKLMDEYVGLGGSESKVAGYGGRVVVAALAVLEREEVAVEAGAGDAPPDAAATSTQAAQPRGSSKKVVEAQEQLTSTWEHRAWTYGCIGLLAATSAAGLSEVHTQEQAAAAVVAVAAAYVLSDLGTGVYHWGVDNYGGPDTPLFGRQIAAFQGHHQRPWTITMREFCNNVHQVFKPATPFAAALLTASPLTPLWWDLWSSSFLFLVCMSQQFHAWSHMKRSELHPMVVALQESGVLISRRAHGAHHRAPFEGNYCIVSGLWNHALDSSAFFRALEKAIHQRTGMEPRCWSDPEHGWEELERPESV